MVGDQPLAGGERNIMGRRRPSLMRLTAAGLYRSGLLRPLSRAMMVVGGRAAFPILTYHRINDDHDPFFESVPTSVFEQHVSHLAHAYRVRPLEELVEEVRHRRCPPRAVAVTFDDGYRDNLTHAAPILARLGIPATIFLATGFIGSGRVAWTDRLALALKTTPAASFIAPWGPCLPLTTPEERLLALGQTRDYLRHQPHELCLATVDRLLAALRFDGDTHLKGLMLNWDDVSALAGLGFSIGAHTVNHPILSRLSLEQARLEIEGSRAAIELACGIAPRTFAYPNGRAEDYSEAVARLVREAGFSGAVTTRSGINTAATDPYQLRRASPWDHDVALFALRLARDYVLPPSRAN